MRSRCWSVRSSSTERAPDKQVAIPVVFITARCLRTLRSGRLCCMSGTVQVAAGAPTESASVAPALLFGGAAVLVYRTVFLLSGARSVLKGWVVALTIVEMAVDIATLLAAVRWWVTRDPHHSRPAMRFGAAATLLHAMRVSVFVLGRTGPWRDFDVRPEHRPDHDQRWTWGGVVVAGVMSALGFLGVGIIWQLRRSAATHRPEGPPLPVDRRRCLSPRH